MNFELSILKSIQSFANPFLDVFFEMITFIAEPYILIAIVFLLYYLFHKEFGEYLIYSMLTSLIINTGFKNVFKVDRLIGEEGIRTLRAQTATGYSFPSGHSQSASTFFFGVANYMKKRIWWILSILITSLVCFSRLYLGVHYPKDVIAGFLLGLLLSYLCYKLYFNVQNKLLLYLLTPLALVPFFFFGISEDFIKFFGAMVGFSLGAIIEKKYVNFTTNRLSLKCCIFRCLLAGMIIGVYFILFQLFLPEGLLFDFIKYALLVFLAIGIVPLSFKFFRIHKNA